MNTNVNNNIVELIDFTDDNLTDSFNLKVKLTGKKVTMVPKKLK